MGKKRRALLCPAKVRIPPELVDIFVKLQPQMLVYLWLKYKVENYNYIHKRLYQQCQVEEKLYKSEKFGVWISIQPTLLLYSEINPVQLIIFGGLIENISEEIA